MGNFLWLTLMVHTIVLTRKVLLVYSLVTKWTSLVTRGERIYNNPTNNRAELSAILDVLSQCHNAAFPQDVVIYSDSQYSIGAIHNLMVQGVVRSNQDILIDIEVALNMNNCRITIKIVRAHCGIFGNEVADKLCNTLVK